ncbi:uncharacterized protein LOC128552339 [Mercenaria mercenaria]|uniref:uncharacterized protein LOC128552339 n=1 Tax=Mercenaria mercenaria TaxID=6596 RepID=UPI00234F9F56|nr:uncharacterized protein LOC128552339 [Mercenaria mercenaria]
MALNIIVEDSKHCTPCKTKDKKIESQYYCTDCEAYYCEDCFELHPRVPYLAKHIVLKHDDIAVWSNLQYKCTTHDKNLEFFCGEHKLLCCHVCVSLKHRACANMEYVLESAKNICLNDEIKTMIQHTQEKLDKIESYADKIRHKTEVNENSKEEYIKELEGYRSRLNKMFDVLMKNALDEMNERVDRNSKYSEEMTKELKNFGKELQDLKHQLTTSTAGKEVLIYISLKRGESLVEEITKTLSEINITTDKDNFKPVFDNKVEEYVRNVKQIAYLEDEQMRQEAVSSKECLVQASVSSEEYQDLTSILYEEENTLVQGTLTSEKYESHESAVFENVIQLESEPLPKVEKWEEQYELEAETIKAYEEPELFFEYKGQTYVPRGMECVQTVNYPVIEKCVEAPEEKTKICNERQYDKSMLQMDKGYAGTYCDTLKQSHSKSRYSPKVKPGKGNVKEKVPERIEQYTGKSVNKGEIKCDKYWSNSQSRDCCWNCGGYKTKQGFCSECGTVWK